MVFIQPVNADLAVTIPGPAHLGHLSTQSLLHQTLQGAKLGSKSTREGCVGQLLHEDFRRLDSMSPSSSNLEAHQSQECSLAHAKLTRYESPQLDVPRGLSVCYVDIRESDVLCWESVYVEKNARHDTL